MKRMTMGLYLAGALAANAAGLDDVALEGDMRKLAVHDAPRDVSEAAFTDPDGAEATLGDYAGQVVLLNFWATWCAPCREEMPALDMLEQDYGGADFSVVTLATGRNSLTGIETFFEEESVEALPIWLDPKQTVARDMAVLGLPVTVVLNREGLEIARLTGGADWSAPEARAVIETLIGE